MRAKDSVRPHRWFSAAVLSLALTTATPGLAQVRQPADLSLSYTELLQKIQQNQVSEIAINRQKRRNLPVWSRSWRTPYRGSIPVTLPP